MKITIDGEKLEVVDVNDAYYGVEVELEDGREFRLFSSAAEAGIQARKYWEDMAEGDPREFACTVGQETLVAWALGQYAGPGSTPVTSLDEWLDLWLGAPAEEWNRQDGSTESKIYIGPGSEAADEIGFDDDAVAYER